MNNIWFLPSTDQGKFARETTDVPPIILSSNERS
jgi:hypothetical protein